MTDHGSELTESGLPCSSCGSSDAVARYDDGHTYCFSCSKHTQGEDRSSEEATIERRARALSGDLLSGDARELPRRGIGRKACQKMDYRVGTDSFGEQAQIASYYGPDGRKVAQKIRRAGKKFSWIGEPKQALLFGQHAWGSGGKRVVVTEGELDAVAYCDATDCRWPVVSIPNGAQGARKDLARQLEWLETFDQVVLMFDEDDPGRKAAAECAELFTPGKVRIARLPLKDAAEMTAAGRGRELVSCVWEASPFRPDGVVNGSELWDEVSHPPSRGGSYPWPCLDEKLRGQRQREIVTWAAGTGTGKSSIIRELAYHSVVHCGQTAAIIALESSVRTEALHQMAIHLGRRIHLPEEHEAVSKKDLQAAFDATLGTGRYLFHFGSLEPERLLPKIRFMVLADGARWVFLDHISLMVSGSAAQGDERKRIDELMTGLRVLVDELSFGLHIVTHLRRPHGTPHEEGGRVTLADLRGSGAIAQISDAVIGVERDQQDPEASLLASLRVLKNRYVGTTGLAGVLRWDEKHGRLTQDDDALALLKDESPRGSGEQGEF